MSHVDVNLEIPESIRSTRSNSRLQVINTQNGDIVIVNRTGHSPCTVCCSYSLVGGVLSSSDLSLPSPLSHAYCFESTATAPSLAMMPIRYALYGPQSSHALTLYSSRSSSLAAPFAATLSRSSDGGYFAVEYRVATTLESAAMSPMLEGAQIEIDLDEGVGSLEEGFVREPGMPRLVFRVVLLVSAMIAVDLVSVLFLL